MFLIAFLRAFFVLLWHISPVLLFLISIIVFLGLWVARIEKWPLTRGIYCAFITATTVGYGVVHPTTPGSRILCVIIALIGVIFTGVIVALALQALQIAVQYTGMIEKMIEKTPVISERLIPG